MEHLETFIEQLEKRGFTTHEGLDSFTLIFQDKINKSHELNNVRLQLDKAGDAIHYKFVKTNPDKANKGDLVAISGYADTQKKLVDVYTGFVNAVKLVKNKNIHRS